MDLSEAYIAAFNLLDSYYDEKKDDTLGMLLSSMNPYLFIDSQSADPAIWHDWLACSKKISCNEDLTSDEAFRVTYQFVKFHQEEFGYNLKWLIDKLNAISVDNEDWVRSVKNALSQ